MDAGLLTLTALAAWSYAGFAANHVDRWPPASWGRSRCPACQVQLSAWELLPVLAYLALRGRCRHCRAAIGFPLLAIESSFLLLVPLALAGAASPLTLGAWALLLHGAWIDARHGWIPDGLTYAAFAIALLSTFSSAGVGAGIGALGGAAAAASLAAGGLVLIAGLAGLALRAGRDRRERLTPFSYDTLWTAAAAGLLAGLAAGLIAGGLQGLASHLNRRPLRLREPPLLLGWLFVATLLVLREGFAPLAASLQAAGAWALLAGAYLAWAPPTTDAEPDQRDPAAADPEALGFGDVKLAGALGALLGAPGVLLALALAVGVGAVVGSALWPSGRRTLPFAPFLWFGGYLVALTPAPLLDAARSIGGLW